MYVCSKTAGRDVTERSTAQYTVQYSPRAKGEKPLGVGGREKGMVMLMMMMMMMMMGYSIKGGHNDVIKNGEKGRENRKKKTVCTKQTPNKIHA